MGENDKLFRLRISRKEAKETIYWLMILKNTNPEHKLEIDSHVDEANELKKIISSIIIKLERKKQMQ